MKCDECGGQMTVERNAKRRYEIGGLPHVVLQGVEVSQCKDCGKEEIAIPRIGQLHHVIAMALAKQPRMLAPSEIRFLRKHTGHSTGDIAQAMGVSRETISRWETGAKSMSALADRLLRVIVLTHEPTGDYAAKDDAAAVAELLKSLNDTPTPAKLVPVQLRNSKDGWIRAMEGKRLAMV